MKQIVTCALSAFDGAHCYAAGIRIIIVFPDGLMEKINQYLKPEPVHREVQQGGVP